MAYPNLSADDETGAAFTVELTEKNPPVDQGPQVGFEGMEDKEQRKLLTSNPDVSRRPRLNTAERVGYIIMQYVMFYLLRVSCLFHTYLFHIYHSRFLLSCNYGFIMIS